MVSSRVLAVDGFSGPSHPAKKMMVANKGFNAFKVHQDFQLGGNIDAEPPEDLEFKTFFKFFAVKIGLTRGP
jgi:hypothetical protein